MTLLLKGLLFATRGRRYVDLTSKKRKKDGLYLYHAITMSTEPNSAPQQEEKEEQEKWEKSKSKALLRAGILSGEIRPNWPPKKVFNMNPEEHGKWKYKSWTSNLSNLREAIERNRSCMQRDAIAYGHDLAIAKELRSQEVKPVWHRTEAPKLLKQDVNEGKNHQMKPRELHQSRPEYMMFDLKEFRKHLYQEIDCRPKRAIRFERKKKAWKYPELHQDHPRLQNNPDSTSQMTLFHNGYVSIDHLSSLLAIAVRHGGSSSKATFPSF